MCEICELKNQADSVLRELKVLRQKIDIATAQFTLAVDERDPKRQREAREEMLEFTGQSFDKYAVLVGLRSSMEETLRRKMEDPAEGLLSLFRSGGHGPH